MDKVYIIINYNYDCMEDYEDQRDVDFDECDETYPIISAGAFERKEDAMVKAIDLANKENYQVGYPNSIICVSDNFAAVIFEDGDPDSTVSVYFVHELEVH